MGNSSKVLEKLEQVTKDLTRIEREYAQVRIYQSNNGNYSYIESLKSKINALETQKFNLEKSLQSSLHC